MDALKLIAQDSLKSEVSEAIKVGNTIKIWVKIREGERERLQAFEGTVIARKGSGVSETFTVRRVAYGVKEAWDLAETPAAETELDAEAIAKMVIAALKEL